MICTISNIRASVENTEILRGVSLTLRSGEVHAVMGPNGGGKSTLAAVLLGSPIYTVSGSIVLGKTEISGLSPEERAKAGFFLAFQSPVAIPGVTVMNVLRAAYQSRHSGIDHSKRIQNPILAKRAMVGKMPISEFTAMVTTYASTLHLDQGLLRRGIHDGFSGGERKKIEMLEALVLEPTVAVFDEIDTGLDVDALKVVAGGIETLRKKGTICVIITHYQRILRYVKPDRVHVLVSGTVVKSGPSSLAKTIEKNGYQAFQTNAE